MKLLGKQIIGEKQFNGVVGGFGKDKRAMLVKDIATIHDKDIYGITPEGTPRDATPSKARGIHRVRNSLSELS